MPNYTWNTIKANKKVIKGLLNEEGNFSFQNIIPSPEELELTTSGGCVDDLIGLYLIENYTLDKYKELSYKVGIRTLGNKKTKQEIKDYFLDRLDGKTVDIIRDGYGDDAKELARVTGEEYFNMHMKYGCHDWYTWHNRYWGTKWDAFDVYINDNMISFTTAWCMPQPVFDKICAMFPEEEISFTAEYEDNYFCEGSNHDGEFCIDGEYEKQYPDDFDWDDDDYEDIPWINLETGEEL